MQQMQQIGQTAELDGAERKRVEAVVETLATLRNKGETLSEVAHDARNMVTALGLYCDLLEEPGVLAAPFLHYGSELRLVSAASRCLVEKLLALDSREMPVVASSNGPIRSQRSFVAATPAINRPEDSRERGMFPPRQIDSLARELEANRNLLSALTGPAIELTVKTEGGALPVRLTGEDLTRVLVNMVKNAAEAMPGGGHIAIGLHEFHSGTETAPWLVLTVEDDGPGIPRSALEKVFESGYTTSTNSSTGNGGPRRTHRGLGLSISRSILEAAGGTIHATNGTLGGTRLVIELPIRTR